MRRNLTQIGVVETLLYALKRTLASLGGADLIVYRVMAQPVAQGSILDSRRGGSVQVREAPEGDAALEALPLTAEVIAGRFAQGAHCFVAERGGRAVGCLWLCLEQYEEDEVRCLFRLSPDDASAWDFDVFVEDDQRGGVVFASLWEAAFEYMRSIGLRWTLSRISVFNPWSVTAHRRLGAFPIGWLVVMLGRRWQIAASSLSPHVHLSARPGRRPVYQVRPPT